MNWLLKIFSTLLVLPGVLCAQVNFTSIPSDLELIPRDADNFGRFTIAGTCTSNAGYKIHTIVTNITEGIDTDERYTLINTGGNFEISLQIKSSLTEYAVTVLLVNNDQSETFIKKINNLVAGDVYIIAGQSNAVAPPFDNYGGLSLDSLYSLYCCRTIGMHPAVAMDLKLGIADDSKFYRPTGVPRSLLTAGFVGVWGIKLQHDLALQTGIPNCVVNASLGAKRISEFYASHVPSDTAQLVTALDSGNAPRFWLYDRLYKKLSNTGVTTRVKAIFWYQGESDGNSPIDYTKGYAARFDSLYTSWKLDYKGLERIFLLQINTGCGGANMSLIRQIQADLAQMYPNITIMSTVGSTPSDKAADGCHYSVKGYLDIAEKLVPAVRKLIYQHNLPEDSIFPPQLTKAYYTDLLTICLEFDRDVYVQESTAYDSPDNNGTAYLTDYFYDELGAMANPSKITFVKNKVYLHFDKVSEMHAITYLPDTYSNIPTIYAGPWIVNAENHKLGALSFHKRPLTPFQPETEAEVYPNPSSGTFCVSLAALKTAKSLRVFDLAGKQVFYQVSPFATPFLNLGYLVAGMYIVKLEIEGNNRFVKIVIR